MKGNSSFWLRLRVAVRAGLVSGLILGHIDLLVRIAHLSFEWFEFYQSLMIPALIMGFTFGCLALVVQAIVHGCRKSIDDESFRYSLTLLSLSFPFGLLCWIVLQLLVIGDLKSIRVVPDTAATLFLATLALVALAIGVFRRFLPKLTLERLSKFGAPVWDGYFIFCIVFCLSLALYDLYLYHGVQGGSPKTSGTKTDGPNVILITLDTLRADHLPFYGYPKDTAPFLTDLASKSVVFSNAISTAPWTLPAHASLFTGKYVFRHGAHLNHQQLTSDQTTLAEVLQGKGYRTAGFVAGPYCKAKYGLAQGFDVYRDRMDFLEYRHTQDWVSIVRLMSFFSIDLRNWLLGTDGEVSAPEVNENALEWLVQPNDAPFFLFLNYFDVHDPYNRGDDYLHYFTSERRDWKPIEMLLLGLSEDPVLRYSYQRPDEPFVAYLKALYDAEIRYLDEHLRRLFEELGERGLLENTVVIITSDHGDEFFDHGGVLHMQTLYQEMIHIPLLVFARGKFPSHRESQVVSITDVFATVLDVVGDSSFSRPEDSVSFFSSLTGTPKELSRESVISERYVRDPLFESQQTAVTSRNWKYIEVSPERERIFTALFDLENDPGETHSVLHESDREEAKKQREALSTLAETVRQSREQSGVRLE